MGSTVVLQDVWYRYPGGDWILRGVNAEFIKGINLIVGSTGSGKTTILRIAAGTAVRIHGGELRGSVEVGGKSVLIPQDFDYFILNLTVEEELMYSLESSGVPVDVARREAKVLAENLGISHLLDKRVSTLSTGERQRVAIASALALGAEILLIDEPLAYQDPIGARSIVELLSRIDVDSVIVAEHKAHYFLETASRVYITNHGKVVQVNAPWVSLEVSSWVEEKDDWWLKCLGGSSGM
ncbi:MAG: energy-coupling factor ABC transporter ATP-binding protein [Aeropyrum sp.]|nr:energy-coupling factor ABC transporter ATP-binding protein [Aeropyrum sp.]